MRPFTSAVMCASLLLAGEAVAYEYVIFKRIHEDLKITSLPFKHTVWHIDALNLLKFRIESAAASVPAERRIDFMHSALNEIAPSVIEALLLMGYSGTEKMIAYGLNDTPAAVLLDDNGNVVLRWNGLDNGVELYNSEQTP